MERIHFLNVLQGDCSWIEHASGRNTVIDICNGNSDFSNTSVNLSEHIIHGTTEALGSGNYNQKHNPTNPIEYFAEHNMPKEIFRFILTHPDMDHMDGLKRLFGTYNIINFWDTENKKSLNEFYGRYSEEDWDFYQRLRKSEMSSKILFYHDGDQYEYFMNDGIEVLSPSKELDEIAISKKDYNINSYVILFTSQIGAKILFCGDSDDTAWTNIMNDYADKVTDIDLLIAPHHGRTTGGCSRYLNILKPKLTLFGNANSQYLDYDSWNRGNYLHYTNNQAGNVVVEFSMGLGKSRIITVYCSNKKFAEDRNPGIKDSNMFYNRILNMYFLRSI